MIIEKPDVLPSGRYPVNKVATILGISKNTVRNWIKNGNFLPEETNKHQYGHKGTFIYGRGILRVWGATLIEE